MQETSSSSSLSRIANVYISPFPKALPRPQEKKVENALKNLFSTLTDSLRYLNVSKTLAAKILYPTSDGQKWEDRRQVMQKDLGGVRIRAQSPDGSLLDGMLFPANSSSDPLSQKAMVFVPGMDGYYEDDFSDYLIRLFKDKLPSMNFLILNHPDVMASKGNLTVDGMALTAFTACSYLIEKVGINPNDLIVYGQSLGGVAATRGARWLQVEYPEAEMKLINERSFLNFPEVVEAYYGNGPIGRLLNYASDSTGWSTPDVLDAFDAIKGDKLVIYSPYDGVVLKTFSLFQKLEARGNSGEKVKILEMEGENIKPEEHWRKFTPREEDTMIYEIHHMFGQTFKAPQKETLSLLTPLVEDENPFASMIGEQFFD